MDAFATLDDYEARYGTAPDAARAKVMLQDASEFLASELARCGKSADASDELQVSALRRICCRLANGALDVPGDVAGVNQTSFTAGPFNQSFTFANPTGAFKLLQSERRTLGIGTVRAGSVAPKVWGADD